MDLLADLDRFLPHDAVLAIELVDKTCDGRRLVAVSYTSVNGNAPTISLRFVPDVVVVAVNSALHPSGIA